MSYRQPSIPPRKPFLIHQGPPKRFRLHTERIVLDENGKVRKWSLGTKDTRKPNKIVLLVGETGAGKTTLINTMFNYLLRVKFEDEIWYEITEEKAKDQSDSQTSEITMYEVFHVKSPISLTIIDTPGYGDTRGLDKDLEIAENLAVLFQSKDGVCEVDAVCFVIQASKNRLSDRQYYIFSSILSLFGKDIVNNIVFLITHSDGLPPKNVLSAINKAKIPCRRDQSGQPVYFLLNNRQAEARQTERRYVRAQTDAWENSMDGMMHFFQSLDKMNRRSLELTSHVLMERIQFEAYICNLQLQVQLKELKVAEKCQIQEAIRQNKEKINKNNFSFPIKMAVKEKVPIESAVWKHRKATTCTVCEENCHEFNCWWGFSPSLCEVMKNGYCTVCKGKCHHSKHVKENKKYVIKYTTKMLDFNSIKKEYEIAQGEESRKSLDLIKKLDDDLKEIENQKSTLLSEAYQTIKHLFQIALKPDSAFTLQHLDFFIPRVREAGKENWVRELEEMRRTAVAEEANKDVLSYLQAGIAKMNLFFSGKNKR